MNPIEIKTGDGTEQLTISNGDVIEKVTVYGGGGGQGESGHSPYISQKTGTWIEYSDVNKTYVDTGVIAEGYTPIKGVDYWTQADKDEIKIYAEETAKQTVSGMDLISKNDIGKGLKIDGGKLAVDTSDVVRSADERPITSSAVDAVVGNINILLANI